MSVPFGNPLDMSNLSAAAQLRGFDEVIRAYVVARGKAVTADVEAVGSDDELDDDSLQRLADASQQLFTAGETLKAYAMVLSGNGVFDAAASLADDAALVDAGMIGPY